MLHAVALVPAGPWVVPLGRPAVARPVAGLLLMSYTAHAVLHAVAMVQGGPWVVRLGSLLSVRLNLSIQHDKHGSASFLIDDSTSNQTRVQGTTG